MRLSSESSPPLHPSELAEAPVEEKSSDSESDSSEPRPLSLKKRRAIVAPACTPYGTLPETFDVSRLLSVRPGKRTREFLVRWLGWGVRGDTWEPEAHLPEEDVAAFDAIPRVLVSMVLPMRFPREVVVRRLASSKKLDRKPAYKIDLEVPQLKVPELGLAVLKAMAEEAESDISVEYEAAYTTTTERWVIYLEQPADIANVLALHAVRPEMAFGNLRIKCGAVSYTDMAYVLPTLEIYYTQPIPTLEAPPLAGGRSFRIKLSYAIINGKTGRMDFPAILDNSERFSSAEMEVLIEHAKGMLAQQWQARPVANELRKKGWHALPRNQPRLPIAVAMPSE